MLNMKKTILLGLTAVLALILVAPSVSAAVTTGDVVVITDKTTLGGYMDIIVNATSLRAKQWQVQEIYLYLDTNGLAEISDNAWTLIGPSSDTTIYAGSVNLEQQELIFIRVRLPDTDAFNNWVKSDSDGWFYIKAYGGPGLVAVSNRVNITAGRATIEKAADTFVSFNNYKFSYVANKWIGSSNRMNFTLNFTALFNETIDLTKANMTSLKLWNEASGQELCLACRANSTAPFTSDVVATGGIALNGTDTLNITNASIQDFSLNLTDTEDVGGVSTAYAEFKLKGNLEFSTATWYNLTDPTQGYGKTPSQAGVTSMYVYDWLASPVCQKISGANMEEYWERSVASYSAKFRKFFTEEKSLKFYPSIEVTYHPPATLLKLGSIDVVGHQFTAGQSSDFIHLYLKTEEGFSLFVSINVSNVAAVGNNGKITLAGIELPYAGYGAEPMYLALTTNMSSTKFSSLPTEDYITVKPNIQVSIADSSGAFRTGTTIVAPYDYVLIKGVGFHAGIMVSVKIYNSSALLKTITTQVAEDGSLTTNDVGNLTAVIRVPTEVVNNGFFNFTVVDEKGAFNGTGLVYQAKLDGSTAKVFIGNFKVTTESIKPESATIRYAYNATWKPADSRKLVVEIIGAKTATNNVFNISLVMDATVAAFYGLSSGKSYLVSKNIETSCGYAKVTVDMPEALWAGNYTVVVENATAAWRTDSKNFANVTIMPTVAALGRFPAGVWKETVSASLEDTVDFMGLGWGNATVNMIVAGDVIYSVTRDEISDGKFLIEDIPVTKLSPIAYSVKVFFEQSPSATIKFKEFVVISVVKLPVFDILVKVSSPKAMPGEILDIFILPRLDGAPFAEAAEGTGTLEKIVVKVFVKDTESSEAKLYKTIVITSDNIEEYLIDSETGLLHVMIKVPETALGKALAVEVNGEATLLQFAPKSYTTIAAVSVMNLDEMEKELVNSMKESEQNILNAISSSAAEIKNAISSSENNILNTLPDSVVEALTPKLESMSKDITSVISSSSDSISTKVSSEITAVKNDILSKIDELKTTLATKDDVSQVGSKVESLGGSITMYGAASVILAVIILGLLAYVAFARKG